MKYLFYAMALVLAIYFIATGDDIRSDIYTAAVFVMSYVELRKAA
ncbi:hypothetical protein FJMB80055_18730 [Enterobacter hormaechei]|nr:hypothetical protein FJMB80003_14270 [Enterobacter hormaechei]BDI87763.1 hypothetical protein FJMB80003_15710 [Enterobacter hormaechei]BDJ32257.1 hypothetical protein FJMB80017_22490 [Enterobacter hormaechei]BDJ32912.1 hypothetical protein FJMB80017_29040 [Enterobacter hormaechei]BDJ47010.1 hypothetical protein FJMB80023_22290 [Enterobacter hormaechei]